MSDEVKSPEPKSNELMDGTPPSGTILPKEGPSVTVNVAPKNDRPPSVPPVSNGEKGIVESVDRLVKPLDQILVLMQAHVRAQRLLITATALVATMVIVAAVYQFRLTSKIGQLEDKLTSMSKTGEETKSKLAETEKKVDENTLRSLLQPEVRVTADSSGKSNAYLVVKQAATVSSNAGPISLATTMPQPSASTPREVKIPIGAVYSE